MKLGIHVITGLMDIGICVKTHKEICDVSSKCCKFLEIIRTKILCVKWG